MPDELYWRLTPRECFALLEQMTKKAKAESRAENLRTGLIAAAIYNTNMKAGAVPLRADSWLQPEGPQVLTGSAMRDRLLSWVAPKGGRRNAD